MNPTAQTMGFSKEAMGAAVDAVTNREFLQKDYSTANNLAPYNLQAPAKNLYPVLTPLRNSLPRVDGVSGAQGGGSGLAVHWKVVSAIIGSGVSSMPWVPQGQRSGRMSVTTSDQLAAFVTLGEEDQATYEAWSAAKGFEDLAATMRLRLLQGLMIKEEKAILGGNKTMLLGTPATPSVTATSGGEGSIPAAAYSVKVVALTLEGQLAASLSSGVIDVQVITGADGLTYALNGGSSIPSAGGTATLDAPGSLSATVTAKAGAAAYAWYVGTAGSEKLEAITTINSVVLNSLAGTGQLVTDLDGADHSRNNGTTITISGTDYVNPPAFDGVLYTVFNANALQGLGAAYVKALDTGTAGVGTPLTSSGAGTVVEIDDMLQSMWDNYRLGPTVIYVAAQEAKNIRNKVLNGPTTPLLRLVQDTSAPGGYNLTAGGEVAFYFNVFAPNGGYTIPVKIHPNLPAGTILGWCETLPQQYQNNEVPRVAEIRTRRDYYGIDWPARTRQFEVGVYSEEVFVMYAPFAAGIIYNIGNG